MLSLTIFVSVCEAVYFILKSSLSLWGRPLQNTTKIISEKWEDKVTWDKHDTDFLFTSMKVVISTVYTISAANNRMWNVLHDLTFFSLKVLFVRKVDFLILTTGWQLSRQYKTHKNNLFLQVGPFNQVLHLLRHHVCMLPWCCSYNRQ